MKKKMLAAWIVAMAALASAGSLAAHHSLVLYDPTPVQVTGTVVVFQRINPHSIIFIDQETEDGQIQRWAVGGGPGILQFTQTGIDLKAGDVIEVCGFTLTEGGPLPSERPLPEPTQSNLDPSVSNNPGRVMNGTLVRLPNGNNRVWSDYGQLDKCLRFGESRDSLIR